MNRLQEEKENSKNACASGGIGRASQHEMWIHCLVEGKKSREFAIAEPEQIDRLPERTGYPQRAGLLEIQ